MSDVDFFHVKLARLKVALHLSKDKEVAEALGLSDKAFNARKARSSFPEKELRALAQLRPELGIDVDYVLTGEGMRHVTGRLGAKAQALADAALTTGVGRKKNTAVDERVSVNERTVLGTNKAVASLAEQADEARLLAAFRASNSAGRAAILLAARGIAGLSQD